jgi:YHS domain-containing protein
MIILLLLRIALVVLVVRALWLLFSGVLDGYAGRRNLAQPTTKLVRDPVCGMFIAPGRALAARHGDRTLYFCSEQCRSKWQGGRA